MQTPFTVSSEEHGDCNCGLRYGVSAFRRNMLPPSLRYRHWIWRQENSLNVGNHGSDWATPCPIPQLKSSTPWKHYISYFYINFCLIPWSIVLEKLRVAQKRTFFTYYGVFILALRTDQGVKPSTATLSKTYFHFPLWEAKIKFSTEVSTSPTSFEMRVLTKAAPYRDRHTGKPSQPIT
jgi:hypothetical protein